MQDSEKGSELRLLLEWIHKKGSEVQYKDSLSRQFCNPVLDRDKMIKSSAYNRQFNFVPFGKTKESDHVFSNAKGRQLM